MNRIYFMALLLLIATQLVAQQKHIKGPAAVSPPLPMRQVSGIVKETNGDVVMGATVTLNSAKDTLKAATNENGMFVFKEVKLATFVISVKSIGYVTTVRKYLNNDAAEKILLDPLELKSDANQLNEVTINGTPTVTYKTDTVEYRASDYKVRENSTVDELLKKMEGMEVGTDGSLVHQGQQVTKARINGKDYAGGELAQVMQNLPADIVDKIQLVDDYGDQAARTGIKDGDPTKILNITTRADKSVGNMLRVTASGGNDQRYDERVFAQRINGNQQLGVIGNFKNTINGVAGAGNNTGGNNQQGGGNNSGAGNNSASGSGGTTTSGGPSFNYRDHWSRSIQVNANYRYSFNNVKSENSSVGETFSSLGTTSFIRESSGVNRNKTHNANFEFEYTPDSANFLRVTPSFTYDGTTSANQSEYTQTGLLNQFSRGHSTSQNTRPAFGAIVLYQHTFKKPRRNISVQFNLSSGNQQQDREQNTQILYRDATQQLVKDSLVHRTIDRGNLNRNYRTSITYVEPLGPLSQLELNTQVNYRGYENNAVTSNIGADGNAFPVDSLSNIYTYAFTETRIAVNYRLNKKNYNLSLGLTAIPSHLQGNNISKSTTTNRNNFYVIPIFRFQYVWSRQHRLSVNYSGAPSEPSFSQIQPLPDYSDPQNPVFGNPNLRPAFRHSINTIYNNYLSGSKINLSANINASLYNDQIISNIIQVAQPGLRSFIYETHYTNLSGTRAITGNYSISKQLAERKYNLAFNGLVAYGHSLGMSNSITNTVNSWRFNERFGPRISPNDWLEVNPFVSYDINTSANTLPGANNSNIRTTALSIEGKFFLLKTRTLTIGYNASKNYISGINTNLSRNPFVVNAYIEKEFFRKKSGVLRLSAFDLFDQNNFINRTITQNAITDTRTNALSRYALVSFVWKMQKWSGSPKRNGRDMKRRGDGSFMY